MAIILPDFILRRKTQIAECFYTCKILSTVPVYFNALPYLVAEQKTQWNVLPVQVNNNNTSCTRCVRNGDMAKAYHFVYLAIFILKTRRFMKQM